MENEFIRSFRSFVKNTHDEFGFLCTAVKHAFNLDKKPLFLTGLDLVMEAQGGRCPFCHSASFRNYFFLVLLQKRLAVNALARNSCAIRQRTDRAAQARRSDRPSKPRSSRRASNRSPRPTPSAV